MTRSAVIIYNPRSGRRHGRQHAVSEMVHALERRGLRVQARATAAPGDATRLTRDAVDASAQTIVVHGGDGTVNEALQPLVGGTTSLAVWPRGTANVLAQELGLPAAPDGIADMIAAGRTRRVSVGRAGARYFLVMAGIGLDAAVARAVNPRLKRLLGPNAFWLAWARLLVRWRPPSFLVEVDGQPYGATFTVLANAASYGGGLRIAPRASLDSGCLGLCLFQWRDRRRYIRHLRSAMAGTHLGLPGVTYVQARQAAASGAGVWVQADGELIGALPMTFECLPAALSLCRDRGRPSGVSMPRQKRTCGIWRDFGTQTSSSHP